MVFVIFFSIGVNVSGEKHSGYPRSGPISGNYGKLILHRAVGFVKHFIFSLKELQALRTRAGADRDGLVSGVGHLEMRAYFFNESWRMASQAM